MILEATHTHLYPGHRGRISGLGRIAELSSGGDCLVEFSDGSATPAKISRSAGDWRLDTGAYRTAAGTDIPARSWLIRFEEGGDEAGFRILRRAA